MSDASAIPPDERRPATAPPVQSVPPSGPAGVSPQPQPPYSPVPYHHNPYGNSAYGPPGYGRRHPDARPGTVLAAGIVTLVTTGLMLAVLAVLLFFLLVARTEFMAGFTGEARTESGDPSAHSDLYVGILVVLLVLIVWCLGALVLAILALRRSHVARIMLVVSAAVASLVSLLAIMSGFSVVPLVASVAVIVLLFTGGAGDWYHREHLYSQPRLPSL